MKKIIIVDDESLVRVGLQSIIPWEEYGYSVSGAYKNGREALDACLESMPDAILTDIRMPVMDGLELIKRIRELSPRLPIVILSSYDDFEYTRTAIRLGVQDYIQKHQLEPEELIRMLNGLKIEENGAFEEKSEQNLKNEKEELLNALPRLEKSGEKQPAAGKIRPLPELEKLIREQGPYVCWVMIQPSRSGGTDERNQPQAYSFLLQEELGRYRHTEYIGTRGTVVHALFYLGEERLQEGALRSRIAPFGEKLRETLLHKFNLDFAIGVGQPNSLEAVDSLYASATCALLATFYGHGGLIFDNGTFSRTVYSEDQWIEIYRALKRFVQQEQFGELLGWLEEKLASGAGETHPREWKRVGVTLATHVTDYLIEQQASDAERIKRHFGELWPLERYIEGENEQAGWLASIRLMLERTEALLASARADKHWLARIKQYVNGHYAEPIRLEEAAELVFWSENYFSQRFSQEMGMTFSEYVTGVRIAKAKELLKNTDCTTEEISGMVGYVNANYLVKVFKKSTGLTISEFKSQYKS